MDRLPPFSPLLYKKIENLEKNVINLEIWRKISDKTKSVDFRLQEIQKLVLKSDVVVAKIMNLLYEAKQNQEASMLAMTKSGIRLCPDTAMLIGQTNFEILNFRSAKIMPELNYSYRQLSFDQGDQSKLLFGDNLPKQIKYIFETSKVGFAVSRKSFTPSSSISISLINLHKIKSSLLFCTAGGGYQEEDLCTCRVSRTHAIKITENSRANGITQELHIRIKAEMPAHCDTGKKN